MTAQLPQNPFPGMNPYLESPQLWPGIHTAIISGLQRWLGPRLRPEYIVRTGERVYVSEESAGDGPRAFRIPDTMILDGGAAAPEVVALAEPKQQDGAIAVRLPEPEVEIENYLEILRVGSREVIAVAELLSPINKYGAGRRSYLVKRAQVLYSLTHLVEIDLLRAGPSMPVIGDVSRRHYRILVANARRTEPVADLYSFGIDQPIPDFVIPLAKGSEGIAVNLKSVLDDVYAIGSYDSDIDYDLDPEPPLSDADRAWLDQLLREKGLRDTTV